MKLIPSIIVFMLIFTCSVNGQVFDSLKFKSLQPRDFQSAYRHEGNALLIDVREFFEFKKSRLQNAVNIPSSGHLGNAADTINKEYALFLYCTSGFRSKRVANFFYDKGFRRLFSLQGGITAWKKEGLPVDKKRLKATSRAAASKS
jgi:rhodanese-related sulfurtransferase